MFNVLQMMTTMGLMDSAYWLTWLLWEVVLVFVSSLLLVCFGLLFQFDFFLHNNFGVLFFIFFLFSLNMVNSQPQSYNKIITMRVCYCHVLFSMLCFEATKIHFAFDVLISDVDQEFIIALYILKVY